MLSVTYANKNAYRAGKLMEFFRGGALGANIGNELAHCVCVWGVY